MRAKVRVLMAALAGGPMAAVVIVAVALAAASPSVVTGSATQVADNSAVLNGTVNPNGSATTYYFQWGLTNSYGLTGASHSAGSGTKDKAVAETAGSLIPGTTYHYRLVASNRYGSTVGADRTFTTAGHPPPNATTGPANGLSATGATLTGVISPNGQETSWTFQYGPTTGYGFETYGGTIPASSSTIDVASQLQAIAPGTIFHYRLVAAHNNAPTSYGADETFMTYPSPRPRPSVHAGTSPRRARHRPYLLTTTGHLRGPRWIPSVYACAGNVEIQFFDGRRRIGSTFVAVQPSCVFSGTKAFRRLPGRGRHRPPATLRVLVQFLGNNYLAPNHAASETVTIG
jgi:hypothetical protein